LGHPQKEELLILAFDHRTQCEVSCRKNGLSTDKIAVFKDLVCEGFQNIRKTNAHKGLAILIDPEYGRNILTTSADADYTIGVPIEKAGSFPVQWLTDDSLYQQLLESPGDWFVKVIWHFHASMTSKETTESPVGELQLQQL
jgi:5-dehydro-2-deoxygluconokinase